MCLCVEGGESKGLRLNDLHPHPLSILNFKFVIRKQTLWLKGAERYRLMEN